MYTLDLELGMFQALIINCLTDIRWCRCEADNFNSIMDENTMPAEGVEETTASTEEEETTATEESAE